MMSNHILGIMPLEKIMMGGGEKQQLLVDTNCCSPDTNTIEKKKLWYNSNNNSPTTVATVLMGSSDDNTIDSGSNDEVDDDWNDSFWADTAAAAAARTPRNDDPIPERRRIITVVQQNKHNQCHDSTAFNISSINYPALQVEMAKSAFLKHPNNQDKWMELVQCFHMMKMKEEEGLPVDISNDNNDDETIAGVIECNNGEEQVVDDAALCQEWANFANFDEMNASAAATEEEEEINLHMQQLSSTIHSSSDNDTFSNTDDKSEDWSEERDVSLSSPPSSTSYSEYKPDSLVFDEQESLCSSNSSSYEQPEEEPHVKRTTNIDYVDAQGYDAYVHTEIQHWENCINRYNQNGVNVVKKAKTPERRNWNVGKIVQVAIDGDDEDDVLYVV